MENLEQLIVLDFYSVGSLIPFLFSFLVGCFLLLIRRRSSAATQFAVMFLGSALMNIAYFYAASFYHPAASYHRWFTVCGALIMETALTQVFFHYPTLTKPRLARGFLIAQWIGLSIVTAYFIIKTNAARHVFLFAGDYWDFDADKLSKIVGIIILTYTLIFVIVATVRTITTPGKPRWALLTMLISGMFGTIVLGVINTLSRDGAIDRGVYQSLYDIISISMFFTLIIVFINTTTDRTSFMAKIVGISLLTLLLLFQAISYYSFKDREESYDIERRSDLARALLDKRFIPENLDYIQAYNISENAYNQVFASPEFLESKQKEFSFDKYESELLNAALRSEISHLQASTFQTELPHILSSAHPYFAGYAGLIQSFAKEIPTGSTEPGLEVLARVDELERKILLSYNKIRVISDENFREDAMSYAEGMPETLSPFKAAILNHIQSSPSEGPKLKTEVLYFFSPLKSIGSRHYRRLNNDSAHFISFMQIDKENGILYEGGFTYFGYRQHLHPTALRLIILMLCMVFIVLVGFRIFFSGALLKPLDQLLAGVAQVNDGNLDVDVPIRVEDEIGFLSRSFNQMVSSIRVAKEKLKMYAENLEQMVEVRTQELKNSLDQVQTLKKQQDGDYYLTSLLIKPLSQNHIGTAQEVSVEFYLEQKKRFEFKNQNIELGGDICNAHQIHLRAKPYTAFLNGDAMGKSMQGAGGALVLGAVFESIIVRTKESSDLMRQYPERWLKNAFTELHRIFESFDGHMLVSVVIGLVDDQTGLLYFINAEHPWTVIYREGKAAFIEKGMTFRKLGMPGMDKNGLFIQTVQLQEGDVVIAGSDGRDDILVHEDSLKKVVTQDENLFLEKVEQGKGELIRIAEAIRGSGDLADDLSLLRIGYKEDWALRQARPEDALVKEKVKLAQIARKNGNISDLTKHLEDAYKIDENQPQVIRYLTKLYIKAKNYKQAANFAELYLSLRPSDSQFLTVGSYCYKMIHDYVKAADLGERYRLREPNGLQNLLNLADVYMKLENPNRAEMLYRQVLEIDPTNRVAHKAMSSLAIPVLK